MTVAPYLSFEGSCEAALAFYRDALGAEIGAMMRYSEAPPGGGAPPGCTPPPADKIMHAQFTLAGTLIMASDGMASGKREFKGIDLNLMVDTPDQAQRYFDALSPGGTVRMPLGPTFYAQAFATVQDKFGVGWMIYAPLPGHG
jgi:PhnB protein